MNYTKGEWKVEVARYATQFPLIHVQASHWVICRIANTDSPEAEANAHLIAAAPETYRELEASQVYLSTLLGIYRLQSGGNNKLTQDLFNQICSNSKALAKARGVIGQ